MEARPSAGRAGSSIKKDVPRVRGRQVAARGGVAPGRWIARDRYDPHGPPARHNVAMSHQVHADTTVAENRATRRLWLGAAGVAGALLALIGFEAARTAPVRGAVRAYSMLIAAANRGDLEAARGLCTDAYLAAHTLEAAEEGGLVGLPRGIHKNFRAWSEGADVLLCPTDPRERVRPVYRLVEREGTWRFDGLAGQLGPGGHVAPAEILTP